MAGRGDKIRSRLGAQVAEGQYYEAQQTYKATFARYNAKGNSDDAYLLLQDGIQQQMKHNQLACGSELLCMLLETYAQNEVPAEGSKLNQVLDMLRCFKAGEGLDGKDVVLELRKCGGMALKWCKRCGDRQAAQNVHGAVGGAIFAVLGTAGLGEAALYYSLSSDMQAYASALQDCIKAGREEERDLFVARSVLQVLACAQWQSTFTQLESARKLQACLPGGGTPLDHCVQLLLVALGKMSRPLFDMVLEQYRPSLGRDDTLAELLDRIGAVFFGSKQAGGGLGGLLGQLLGGMSGDA